MRRTSIALIQCLLLLLVLSACGKPEPSTGAPAGSTGPATQPSPSKVSSVSVVRVIIPDLDARVGGAAQATVKLLVSKGYHVNANPPTFPYLKATEVEAGPGHGVTPGKPIYPPPVTRKFSFEEKPLAVYEDEAQIEVPLQVATSAPRGLQSIPVRVRIQACDDQTCYPPGVVDTAIPFTVK